MEQSQIIFSSREDDYLLIWTFRDVIGNVIEQRLVVVSLVLCCIYSSNLTWRLTRYDNEIHEINDAASMLFLRVKQSWNWQEVLRARQDSSHVIYHPSADEWQMYWFALSCDMPRGWFAIDCRKSAVTMIVLSFSWIFRGKSRRSYETQPSGFFSLLPATACHRCQIL